LLARQPSRERPDLLAQSMPVYGPIIEEGNRTMATYSDEQLEPILDFMVRSRDMLARNTTRVLGLIEARPSLGRPSSRAAGSPRSR
jgi:hypothetical protein